ncbi:cytochrome P450 [Streptomyces sp. ODS28]|uniref:cytochrome P450 family protein n=1 Tax=Streptomyces sp. ODS28 TaxID=3136688 RepID=UPI0031F17040
MTGTDALAQPFDEAFAAAPYEVYGRLREEAPVHRVALPDGSPVWLVMRDEDVRAGLADPRLSVNKAHSATGYRGFSLPPALDANLLNIDHEDHIRLRRLVSQGFTPRHTEKLRARTEEVAEGLADRLAEEFARSERGGRAEWDEQGERGEPGAGRSVDLVAEYATPLPLTVIGDLFAVPEADRRPFAGWVRAMLAMESAAQVGEAIQQMHGFLRNLVRERRQSPGDDLLSDLIAARDAEDRLTEDELCSLAFLLLGAGIENVQHVIGSGLLTLLDHPEQRAELAADPGLLPGAVEELLRCTHPNLAAIRRFPTEPVDFGGVRIPAGDTVLLCLASANRDPARHADPERFDIHRGDPTHLALGQGMHYCLGAPLARMEIGIAVETLLRRFPTLHLAVPAGELEWQTTFRSRGLRSLPVRR